MKKQILTFALAMLPFTTQASVEMFQIVALDWEASQNALTVSSLGSGTAIDKNLVLTNKHVVAPKGEAADFILLCQASDKRTQGVSCDITAGVIALHDQFDAALIKPLSSTHYFPSVRIISGEASIGSHPNLSQNNKNDIAPYLVKEL